MIEKMRVAARVFAVSVIALASVAAQAVDTFDVSSNLLTLQSVTAGGQTYLNAIVKIGGYSQVTVAGGVPGADTFNPATNMLIMGSVTAGGQTYNNVSVHIDSYTVNSVGTPPSSNGRYMQEVFPTVSTAPNLTYGQSTTYTGVSQPLLLDLYQPSGDAIPLRPAIVWIHGGYFISGDKTDSNLVELATRFAKRGYVTVSINYRLRNQTTSTIDTASAANDAMEDAQAAVRWLRKNASTYGIDPAKIVIAGSSAGAITTLDAAYMNGAGTSGNPGFSSQVSAVVDLWGGLSDINAMQAGSPPLLIVHGTLDTTVPYALALQLVARAQAVGVPYEFHPIAGEGHAPWDQMENIIGWTAPFLKTKLGL